MNFILAIFARTIFFVLSPFLIFVTIGIKLSKKESLSLYAKNIAIAYDILINVVGGELWDLLFRKRRIDKCKFGGFRTISCDLGLNKSIYNLTKFGSRVERFLNFLDENHVEKAVNSMKKYLLIFLLFVSGVAQAQHLVFKCDSTFFKSPRIPGGYYVEGISAKALNPILGDTAALFCHFEFYRIVDSTYQKVDEQNDYIPKWVPTDSGLKNLHMMLFSGNKQQIYEAAKIFAEYQGYTLKPLTQQNFLNNLYPE